MGIIDGPPSAVLLCSSFSSKRVVDLGSVGQKRVMYVYVSMIKLWSCLHVLHLVIIIAVVTRACVPWKRSRKPSRTISQIIGPRNVHPRIKLDDRHTCNISTHCTIIEFKAFMHVFQYDNVRPFQWWKTTCICNVCAIRMELVVGGTSHVIYNSKSLWYKKEFDGKELMIVGGMRMKMEEAEVKAKVE